MKMIRDAVIVDIKRSAVGKKKGSLKDIHPADLLGYLFKEIMKDKPFDSSQIDDCIVGCVAQVGEQAADIARAAVLAAGLSHTIPGVTVDRQCGSSQQALHFAAQAVMAGVNDIVLVGGVEIMSKYGMGSNLVGITSQNAMPKGMKARYDQDPYFPNQFVGAEKIAAKWGISRKDCEELSCLSNARATKARDEGIFREEIIPVPLENEDGTVTMFDTDEVIRTGTTMEGLAALNPVMGEKGMLTAGTSSPVCDGAAAALVMDRETAEKMGLKPLARFVAFDAVGDDPYFMLSAPIPATKRVLEKAGLTIDQIDRVEINEAFAPVVLAWMKEMGVDMSKVNVNGGAIALGHPLGASGCRLMTTLVHELKRSKGRYGLQVMCEGIGMANATIIEYLN